MHLRDLILRLFNHTILRIRSFCMEEDSQVENFLANLGVGIARF